MPAGNKYCNERLQIKRGRGMIQLCSGKVLLRSVVSGHWPEQYLHAMKFLLRPPPRASDVFHLNR